MRRNLESAAHGRAVSIAITGGMGAGKSVVSSFLAKRLGWKLLSADSVCRNLLAPGAEGWKVFVGIFGKEYIDEKGEIERSRLRSKIFENNALRQELEAILHPLARQEIQLQAAKSNKSGESVLVEVPLLFEAGWQDDFDKVIVVYAASAVCLARICRRDGVSSAEARKGLAVQIPLGEKAMAADYVVDNSGNWSGTLLQLLHLCEILDDLAGSLGKKT